MLIPGICHHWVAEESCKTIKTDWLRWARRVGAAQALHKLISLLMVKAVMISLIYFSLLVAKPASVGCAAGAAADALPNSTPNSRHRRAAGQQAPLASQTASSSHDSAFSPFLSNIALSSLLSNFVLTPFSFQPIWHEVTPLAFHPDARAVLGHWEVGVTCGMMCHRFAGTSHSSANKMLLFVNLCKSGRGEVSTRAGWFIGG